MGDVTPGDADRLPVHADLRHVLDRSLPSCHPDTVERLVETVRMRTFRAGEHIYPQGEPVPLTVILEGYGAARRTTSSGKEIISGIAPAGVLFGWSGLASIPSSIELVALTNGKVAQWSGREIRELAIKDPRLALAAIDSMGLSLHETVERIEGFLHQDARLRVLRILARHRDLFFGEPPVLPRTLLPGLVGTSREMTGRVLRSLESERVIARVGRRGLRLLEPGALDEALDDRCDASRDAS